MRAGAGRRDGMRPVVVLGAARSGTKILRDALGTALGSGVVPYDVGYVWRHGNESHPDDCLGADAARPDVRRFVRGFVGRYAGPDGGVVEKTVGNTLRPLFVERVLPEALFVHLVRDGVEVAVSARRQWQAPPDPAYLLRKARHFPVRCLPTYGRRYAAASLAGRLPRGEAVRTWGPRYPGIDEDVRTGDLMTVCARQWRACVESASAQLATIGAPAVEVRYEQLVDEPVRVLAELTARCGGPRSGERLHAAAHTLVRQAPAARGLLAPADRATLRREIGGLLEELGYAAP